MRRSLFGSTTERLVTNEWQYYFFVQGCVPNGKDPRALDQKLIAKYDGVKTEGARYWRKTQGLGNVQYVRFRRSWILLATHGDHPVREGEGNNLKDVWRVPIRIGDYSIYVQKGNWLKLGSEEDAATPDGRWRVRVLIAREPFRELCAYFLSIASTTLQLASDSTSMSIAVESSKLPACHYYRGLKERLRRRTLCIHEAIPEL